MPRLSMLKHIRANLSSREYARIRPLVGGVQVVYTIIFEMGTWHPVFVGPCASHTLAVW
jgi:hypothetical protein